jgi:PKD domain-containing protein
VRILLLTLGVLLVLAAPATAAPVASYTVVPNPPIAGEPAAFTSMSTPTPGQTITRVEWDFQSDGVTDVTDTTAPFTAAHTYPNAGSKTLRMTVTDTSLVGATQTSYFNIDVNARPVARFFVSPDAPVTGERVTFRSVSYDPNGTTLSYAWDTDGDGFDDGTGDTASRTFASAGGRLVGLRVTDSNGVSHTAFQAINVTNANGLASAGLSLMNPFPVVRLAGSVFPRGVRVRALEAKTPRRSTVTVLCAGKSCPTKKIVKTAKKRLVRFKAMTRFLRAGTRLSVSVRKGGQIGKYTRWRIRGGKLPKRTDLCLYPNRRKPVRCPS